MADNLTVDNGVLTDYDVVTDEITSPYTGGTKHAQGVKIIDGTADGNTPLTITADGALVNLGANNDVTVTSGSITANAGTNLNTSTLALESGGNLAAAATSLGVMDDWDETNRAAVNIIAGQVGVQGASGVVTALTQRVVLATDVALPAGTNAIGKLAANSGVDIGDVDVTSVSGNVTVINAGTFAVQDSQAITDNAAFTDGTSKVFAAGFIYDEVAGTALTENDVAAARINVNRALVSIIEDGTTRGRYATVTASNALKVDGSAVTQPVSQATASSLNAQVVGSIAHDGVDSGNPVKIGMRALAHGTNPTAVAAADRTDWLANRHGIPWVIGGHPNVVTLRTNYTAAQTDAALITVSTGTKIVVTRCSVTADNANTVDVAVRIGFGTANTPTTTGVVLSHPGIAKGSGVVEGNGSGILGIGGDNEDLRITSEVPTTGSIDIVVSYYTIES